MTIRKAIQTDLPALTEIYNQAIKAGQNAETMTKTIAQRQEWFDNHQLEKHPILVIEEAEQVIGYGTLSKYRAGRAGLRKVVEVSYYIHNQHHRKGAGTFLLNGLLEKSKQLNFKSALAILLDSNAGSIYLLEKYGFKKWGHFPNIVELNNRICGQFIYGKSL
jgi:L-amino acid N-acyltransferase YncA